MPDQTLETTRDSSVATPYSGREYSGKAVIVGIFLFATVMSSGLWIYWHFHTKPFLPLQLAIDQAFPKSYPHVEGGQRRIHKGTPKILRVTLKVKFNPEDATESDQVERIVDRLEELAKRHIDVTNYDVLEAHVVQVQPEHASRTATVTREIAKPAN